MCNTVKVWTHFPLFKKANSMLIIIVSKYQNVLNNNLHTSLYR